MTVVLIWVKSKGKKLDSNNKNKNVHLLRPYFVLESEL